MASNARADDLGSARQRRLSPDASGTKRPTNVSLDAGLVAAAKELGINVSQACETGLAKDISRARGEAWITENWDKVQSWNAYVEEHGLPLEKDRLF